MMRTSELRKRRSSLTLVWDRHVGEAGAPPAAGASDGGVRPEIASSWERSASHISPQVTGAPLTDQGDASTAWESSPLCNAVRTIEAELRAAADDGDLVVAVTDPEARILWTHGGSVMRSRAEKVNFVPGGRWDEQSVGTNALDMALRLDQAATVYSAEHFASCVHDWVCWAAPVHDPHTGRQLGVLDLSTTWDRTHPIGLATAGALAKLVEREIQPGTKFTRSARRRMTEPPCVQRMRAWASVTATTSSPSSAVARSSASIVRTATLSGLDSHALEAPLGSASGASATRGEICQAERSQLDAISGRTPLCDVPPAGAVPIGAGPASPT